ncbi:MAG: 7-cyano-7-deazaguanine synthase, partial [Aquificaceae bacterium]
MANVNKVVVLFSGGVESTCLLYYHLRRGDIVYPLYIRAGHPWEELELKNAQRLWRFTRLRYKNLMPIRVSSFPVKTLRTKEVFIPLRNLSLLAIAGA